MRMKLRAFHILTGIFFALPLSGVRAAEDVKAFSITLAEAQKAAEQNSNALQSAQYLVRAAKSQADSASSSLYPRADLNAGYFYQTHVPTQSSAGSTVKMGDHENYSIGPIISYTLFDGGRTSNAAKSARLNTQAKEQDLLAQKKALAYSVSLTYARVQLYAANLSLTLDSLQLSQNQYADIDLRFNVGTASRLDQVAAHKEMLSYKLLFQQAQNNLSLALKDLFALIGETGTYNTQRPLPSGTGSKLPKDIETPTLLVSVDPLPGSSAVMLAERNHLTPPGEMTPQIKSLALKAQSAQTAAKSQRGANWPKINLSAESRTAYPDSSKHERYNNNIFSVGFSLPLWDWKQNTRQAEKQLSEAHAQEKQKDQKLSDLTRDHGKASDTVVNLEGQLAVSQESTREAEEIARLTYQAYTAGKATYLEVQSANLKLMQAKVETARIEYALVNNMAEMEYLSGSSGQ